MASLGKRFVEIGRGYEKISENYKRPYLIGVDITDKEKPFVVAIGDIHSDFAACVISTEELISGKWDGHINLSNCKGLVEKLKIAVRVGEAFPQKCILDLVNKVQK